MTLYYDPFGYAVVSQTIYMLANSPLHCSKCLKTVGQRQTKDTGPFYNTVSFRASIENSKPIVQVYHAKNGSPRLSCNDSPDGSEEALTLQIFHPKSLPCVCLLADFLPDCLAGSAQRSFSHFKTLFLPPTTIISWVFRFSKKCFPYSLRFSLQRLKNIFAISLS